MATITNYKGGSVPLLVETIGSYGPFAMLKAVPSSAEDTAETFSVTVPNIVNILGYMVQAFSSGNNSKTSDVDVTASGNVLTIAAGSTYTDILSTDYFMIIVWGTVKA